MSNTSRDPSADQSTGVERYDVITIGAGFAGLYMLHRLRQLGFRTRVLEMGDGVGGTWFWNRYPGARCDVESLDYSYSFSPTIQQQWDWTELMAPQPEIERYLNFVADELDLRRDIGFDTKVTALTFDEERTLWTVDTEAGARFEASFVVAATGCLSAPLEPDIPGMASFGGPSLFTNRFPKEGFDFAGKRVAVIGTGSSGVQAIPVIAEDAEHLYVFQRSAAYSIPSGNRPYRPGEFEKAKAEYPELRARARNSPIGATRFGGALVATPPPDQKILEATEERRWAEIEEWGWRGLTRWSDVGMSMEANEVARGMFAELVRRTVKDPDTAVALVPHYPIGCKRQIVDCDYFETFNRDNVTLVDLNKGAITQIVPEGIVTRQGTFEVDVIVFATGFDAMTGALNRIRIEGREGRLLRDQWEADGPATYLGLQVAGFPNLFLITGPGSPSVLTNMVASIEQHVDWIGDCLEHLREHGWCTIEADPAAQADWVEHAESLVAGLMRTAPSCNSWYLGANVPGKKRIFMPYSGGLPTYRKKCEEVVEAGYEGFVLGPPAAGRPLTPGT